jgi:chromosome segregation ATPase
MESNPNLDDFDKRLEFIRRNLKKGGGLEEQLLNIQKQLEGRRDEFTSLRTTISGIRLSVYKLAKDIELLKNNLKTIEERKADHLDYQNLTDKSELSALALDLKSVEKDVENLQELKPRVEDIQASVSALTSLRTDFNVIRESLKKSSLLSGSLSRKVERTEKKLSSMEERFSKISAQTRHLAGKSDINNLSESIRRLKNEVSNIKAAEESFEEKVNEQIVEMLERIVRVREGLVKSEDLKEVENKLSQLEEAGEIAKVLEERVEHTETALKDKADTNQLETLQKRVERVASLSNTLLNKMKLLADKEYPEYDEKISRLGRELDELRRGIKSNQAGLTEKFKEIAMNVEESVKNQNERIERIKRTVERITASSNLTEEKTEKILRAMKQSEADMISPNEFAALKERVFEIEESLKTLEMAYIIGKKRRHKRRKKVKVKPRKISSTSKISAS